MDRNATPQLLHDVPSLAINLVTRPGDGERASNYKVETVMSGSVDCDQVRCKSRAISMNNHA